MIQSLTNDNILQSVDKDAVGGFMAIIVLKQETPYSKSKATRLSPNLATN